MQCLIDIPVQEFVYLLDDRNGHVVTKLRKKSVMGTMRRDDTVEIGSVIAKAVRVLKDKVDCVFQVKENQEDVLEAVKETFKDRKSAKPAAQKPSKKSCVKKRELWMDSINAAWIRDKPKILKRLRFTK